LTSSRRRTLGVKIPQSIRKAVVVTLPVRNIVLVKAPMQEAVITKKSVHPLSVDHDLYMRLVVSRWAIAALRSRRRKGVEANKALLAKMWQYRTKAMKYDA